MATITSVTADNYTVTFTAADRTYTVPKGSIEKIEIAPEDSTLVKVTLEPDFAKTVTYNPLFLDFNSVTSPSESTAAGLLAAVNGLVVDGGIPDNVGSVGTNVTAAESGDKDFHKTVLTLSDVDLGAIAAAAAEATGALVYTFPAGNVQVDDVSISIGLTNSDGNIDADTPDLGIGTTVASGAVSVLGGTAAFENILTGQTVNDVTGTAEVVALTDVDLNIATGGDHTVYLNVADTWAGAETGVLANGTITLFWRFID